MNFLLLALAGAPAWLLGTLAADGAATLRRMVLRSMVMFGPPAG